MAAREPQLHHPAAVDFEAPFFLGNDGSIVSVSAGSIPLVHWPDGSWCFEANRFIRELFERGLKRGPRGGTLGIAAGQISHLLRFCWEKRVHLASLSDDNFTRFVVELGLQRDARNPQKRARNSNTVISIGRRSLDLLSSVGNHLGMPELVSPRGQVRGTRRITDVDRTSSRSRRSKKKKIVYWHHAAFPKPDPKGKGAPIAKVSIDKLRAAAISTCINASHATRGESLVSFHKRDRRLIELLLLECTGARRAEISLLKVDSVRKAALMEYPAILLPTLKKSDPQERYVPVSRVDLRAVLDYIDFSRAPLLKRMKVHDHGLVLINSYNGGPIQANTITNDIGEMAAEAGLIEKASPHMFRHRFITKVFVRLIEQHEVQNPDQLRRLLLDSEMLKRKVCELTGHSDLQSLEVYIHLAFDEVTGFQHTYNLVTGSLVIDSALTALETRLLEFEDPGFDHKAAGKWMRSFLTNVATDLRFAIRQDRRDRNSAAT